MDFPIGLTPSQFFKPENLTFSDTLIIALVYTVVLVALGYVGAVLWQAVRARRKTDE